jgi:hypothetical protein
MRKIIAILLVLCCFWQAFAHNRAGNPARYAPGQLLVKFRDGVSPADQAWVRHLVGAKVLDVKPIWVSSCGRSARLLMCPPSVANCSAPAGWRLPTRTGSCN